MRENTRDHVASRRQVAEQLEEKVTALEERRFISPDEVRRCRLTL